MARSKTFADGEILTPADVNDHLVNHVPKAGDPFSATGTFTPVKTGANDRVQATGLYVRRRGEFVYLDGALAITADGATSFGAGGTYGLATLSPGFAPALTGIQVVVPAPRGTTGPGYLTLIVAAGSGVISVRNDSGVATSLAAGNEIRLSLGYLAA